MGEAQLALGGSRFRVVAAQELARAYDRLPA
jgi:hypothetical protein